MRTWYPAIVFAASVSLSGCKVAGLTIWPDTKPPEVVKTTPAPAPAPKPDPAKPIDTEDSTIFPQPKSFAAKPEPLSLDGADAVANGQGRANPAGSTGQAAVDSTEAKSLTVRSVAADDSGEVAARVRLPAARSLVGQAERARRNGDERGAGALYERALKLDNFDPWLLYGLARLRAAASELQKARSLAARAHFLNHDDRELFARNARLLDELNEALGLKR